MSEPKTESTPEPDALMSCGLPKDMCSSQDLHEALGKPELNKADRERAKKFLESITDQLTSPSYGDCSYEHIKPGSDDALADEFSALRKEEHDSSREREKTMAEALGRFVVFLSFLEAHQECANLKPLEDSDVVVSFMGSGASDSITVGDFRMAREALKALRTK